MTMTIRKYKPEDAAAVDEIYDRCHKGTFGQPDLNHIIDAAVIKDGDKIIGFGCLELIAEAVIIIDTDVSVRRRYHAIRELFESARYIIRDRKFERFYMFPSSEPYMVELIKHFSFNECSPILSYEVGDKNGK